MQIINLYLSYIYTLYMLYTIYTLYIQIFWYRRGNELGKVRLCTHYSYISILLYEYSIYTYADNISYIHMFIIISIYRFWNTSSSAYAIASLLCQAPPPLTAHISVSLLNYYSPLPSTPSLTPQPPIPCSETCSSRQTQPHQDKQH